MNSGQTRAFWRAATQGLALVAAATALSACMGSPTYGTGKPADIQLIEDVTGVLSLGPKNKEQIEYKPRPELVKPASTASLPAPQDSLTTASNPAWPESPEQRRARIRAEATLNRDDPEFQPEVVDTVAAASPSPRKIRTRGDDLNADGSSVGHGAMNNQRAEFQRRLRENNQGSPTSRRYLSEPPTEYRRPVETAAADDLGEDEWKKQQRREQGARKGDGWSLSDLWPF